MILKRNLLALAVASILIGGVHPARATDATPSPGTANSGNADQATTPGDATKKDDKAKKKEDTSELGEISVTGVRAAIERAISVKQNSNEIIEAISAEDIGKLPDNSIADSLARLPGVTAQYVNGQPSLLSVRGFSGDFNGTLVNGREQVSTGDNRAVDFYQFPAEVMTAAQVYKTPEATLLGQGISGTINMDTLRPLDYDKRVIQFGAQAEDAQIGSFNSGTDSKGYRVHGSYVDQFLDHTLGVTVGYARLVAPIQYSDVEEYGYPNVAVPAGTPGATSGQPIASGGEKIYPGSELDTRDALISTIQWRPSEAYESTLDLYYSKDKQDLNYAGFEACTAYCGSTLTNPVVSDGVVVNGDWGGLKPVLREELDAHNDKIYETGWNNKFHFGDHWTASADLSYGKATSNQSFMEQYAGTVPGTPGATDTWNIQIPNIYTGVPVLTPGLDYGDPNIIKLVDSGGWGQDGYLKKLKVTDEIKAARFDLARDLNSAVSKIDVGVNFNDRTKTRNSNEWFLDLPGFSSNSQVSANIPSNCLVPSTYIGYLGFPPTIAWDMNCNLSSYNQITNINADITAKDWTVEEKVTTAYFQANIDTEIADMPLRGNVGAQYVHTEQNSDAFANTGTATTSGGTSYNNFLPDMNLVLSLPAEMDLRFSAGKQLSRPRLDDEKASVESSISVPPPSGYTGPDVTCAPSGVKCLWTASGGNPELKPFIANAYDLSWEKYWDTKGYVQATYWYKQLKTYIYDQQELVDFSTLGVPDPSPTLIPSSSVGLLTEPVNGTGGYMRGYELAGSLPLDTFWEALDGFGVQASFAQTESSIQPNGPGTSSQFPGLSKYVANAIVYYEKAGFSARVAETHRSNYLGEVQAFGADQAFVTIRGATQTDFQLEYTLQDGRFQGLDLILQVKNLFNTPYEEYQNNDLRQVTKYDLFGRHILLGFNYKF